MEFSHFSFPTQIVYGNGSISQICENLKKNGKKRVLLVTDRALARLPIIENIVKSLHKKVKVSIYSDFAGNPIVSDVDNGVKAFKAFKADSLIVVGGGAALDVGKVIGLIATHTGHLFDYEDGKEGALPVCNEIPFWIAIPTTAGTGSEVGRSSVISDDVSKSKKIIFDPKLLAPLVIVDPQLTTGLPPGVTAATGMDALTHNIEAYLAKGYHPICDAIALEAIRMIAQNLEKAVQHPNDLSARGNMLMASLMGSIAFQKGLGLTHSCAHALSTCFDTHHGLANAIMLPACVHFNLTAAPDRCSRIAEAVGIIENSTNKANEKLIAWLKNLNYRLGITNGLTQLNVTITEQLLNVAQADGCHALEPRPVSREDFKLLFKQSM